MKLLTGNDLASGDVVWWTGQDWSRHVEDAVDVGTKGEAILRAEEGARRVNVPYLIDAEATEALAWERWAKETIVDHIPGSG